MGLLQVKPEGGEGDREGVQEGGNSCLQGRMQSPPMALRAKRKVPHGVAPTRLDRKPNWPNITQGLPAPLPAISHR